MPRLSKVPSGPTSFPRKWFSDVVDRIEEIKPISTDENIIIRTTSDGQDIQLNATKQKVIVCVNGVPTEMTFLMAR